MNVSLDQAIEMHAKALEHRKGRQAPHLARDRASHCASTGDREGHRVWSKVADVAEKLLSEKTGRDDATNAV